MLYCQRVLCYINHMESSSLSYYYFAYMFVSFHPPLDQMALALFLFLLLALPVLLIFLFPWNKNSTRKHHLPPGPKGLPFIGNMHQFDSLNPHLYLYKLSKKYGPLMSMKLGNVPVLVISSARIAKQAFTTNDIAFSSRPQLSGTQKFSYDGRDIVFSSYNDYWREVRKTAVINLFSHKQVNSFRPIRQDEVSKMIHDIYEKSNASQLIDLKETLLSLSTSVICRVAFAKSYKETSSGNRTFNKLLEEVQITSSAFYVGDYIPSLGWIDQLSGMNRRLEKCFKESDMFYQELIDEHMKPNRPQSMKGDMVDLLIQLKQDQKSLINFSWDHVKAILMNIFVAGSDTSAAVTTWAMTALIKSPSMMKKAQQEIRGVVGEKRMVDEEDILKLPYLKAVIKETLRLYPPTPLLLPRETTESCSIDGYEILPKTLVFVNFWAIGRDPEYWENPDQFLPDRFLNGTIDYKGKDFGFIPFGSGRRICPGMSLGSATVEMALANLLYSYDWKLPEGMTADDIDSDAAPGITMHKKTALCLLARSYV